MRWLLFVEIGNTETPPSDEKLTELRGDFFNFCGSPGQIDV
jgi:hypothetical protein